MSAETKGGLTQPVRLHPALWTPFTDLHSDFSALRTMGPGRAFERQRRETLLLLGETALIYNTAIANSVRDGRGRSTANIDRDLGLASLLLVLAPFQDMFSDVRLILVGENVGIDNVHVGSDNLVRVSIPHPEPSYERPIILSALLHKMKIQIASRLGANDLISRKILTGAMSQFTPDIEPEDPDEYLYRIAKESNTLSNLIRYATPPDENAPEKVQERFRDQKEKLKAIKQKQCEELYREWKKRQKDPESPQRGTTISFDRKAPDRGRYIVEVRYKKAEKPVIFTLSERMHDEIAKAVNDSLPNA